MFLGLSMMISGSFLGTFGATEAVRHGRPMIIPPDRDEVPDTLRKTLWSWFYGAAFFIGALLTMIGFALCVSSLEANWLVLLLSGLALVTSTALDLSSTMMMSAHRPNDRIGMLHADTSPAIVWVLRVVSAALAGMALYGIDAGLGFPWGLVAILVVWLIPSSAARAVHNRGLPREGST